MSCQACDLAEQNLTSGLYHSNCHQCKVRAVANGRELFEASQAGKITPAYQELLMRMFGHDWKDAHERVKAWKERLRGSNDRNT